MYILGLPVQKPAGSEVGLLLRKLNLVKVRGYVQMVGIPYEGNEA